MSPRRLPLVAFLAVAALLAGTAAAGARSSVVQTSSCREAVAFFLLPVDRLAPHVPAPLVPAEVAPNTGELMVLSTRCSAVTVDGRKQGDVFFSEVAIYIKRPAQATGVAELEEVPYDYFRLWHVSTSADLTRSLRKAGVNDAETAPVRFASTDVQQAESSVSSRRASYDLTVSGSPRGGIFSSRDSSMWSLSGKNLVATRYRVERDTSRLGTATVDVTTPGVVADLTAGTAGRAVGLIADYKTLRATTLRVPR